MPKQCCVYQKKTWVFVLNNQNPLQFIKKIGNFLFDLPNQCSIIFFMLDEALAQKLIDQLSDTTEHSINIMNESGIIIASKDKSRIGSFHETAYNMIVQGTETVEVKDSDKLLGTKQGINMAIKSKNTTVGIIGITGNPDEVRPLGRLLKMSVESLYELELQYEQANKRKSMKDQLLRQILYTEKADIEEIRKEIKAFSYNPNAKRICILVETDGKIQPILDELKRSKLHTAESISNALGESSAIIFLYLPEKTLTTVPLKDYVYNYIGSVYEKCGVYVGSIQSDLIMYRKAYDHCRWLKRYKKGQKGVFFFYDCTEAYFSSTIPLLLYKEVFDGYIEQHTNKNWKDIQKISVALRNNSNNLTLASSELNIHKNTLIYRLAKIKEELFLDPVHNVSESDFLKNLTFYLESNP